MDIWQALTITFRRWYVAVPIVLIGVGAAFLITDAIEPEYTADASVLLVSPTVIDQTAPEEIENPYLSFPGSLDTMAAATQLAVTSDIARAEIEGKGLVSDYEVSIEAKSPIIYVTVTDQDPGLTMDTMEEVVLLISTDLEQRQASEDVPVDQQIETEVLAQSSEPVVDSGGRERVRLVILGVGVLAGVIAAVAVEGLVTLVRRRRSSPSQVRVTVAPASEPVTDRSESRGAQTSAVDDGEQTQPRAADERSRTAQTARPESGDAAGSGSGNADSDDDGVSQPFVAQSGWSPGKPGSREGGTGKSGSREGGTGKSGSAGKSSPRSGSKSGSKPRGGSRSAGEDEATVGSETDS